MSSSIQAVTRSFHLRHISLATLALVGTLAASQASHAETVNIPVPKVIISTAFNAALSSMQVKLDNYGSKHGTSWHQDSSYVLLPGGASKNFSIPEQTFKVTKWRKLHHYIDDMRTSNINARVNGNRIDVSAFFESQGEEVKGKCIRRRLGKWKECTLNMERDIHLNNAQILMSFQPTAYNGSIAFTNAKADFKTDIKIASKLCQAFNGICGWIEGKIKKELTGQIEAQMNSQISSSALKAKVANAVRNTPGFKALIKSNWTVTNVASSGSNFIVTVNRPDQVDGKSVKALTLKPVKKVLKSSCPAKANFSATIKTREAVKGSGWLLYENGKKSKVFKWSAGKNKTITSKLVRSVKGKAGKVKKGWARMTLKWKGTDEKMYKKTSGKAKFTLKCNKSASGSLTFN